MTFRETFIENVLKNVAAFIINGTFSVIAIVLGELGNKLKNFLPDVERLGREPEIFNYWKEFSILFQFSYILIPVAFSIVSLVLYAHVKSWKINFPVKDVSMIRKISRYSIYLSLLCVVLLGVYVFFSPMKADAIREISGLDTIEIFAVLLGVFSMYLSLYVVSSHLLFPSSIRQPLHLLQLLRPL